MGLETLTLAHRKNIADWVWPYVVAVLLLGAAVVIGAALDTVLGSRSPFLFFLLAVAFAGWYGGVGPALLGALAGAVIGINYLIPPHGSLQVESPRDVGIIALYLASGLLLGLFSLDRQRSARRARDARAALQQSEEDMRAVADVASDYAVLLLDRDGRVTRWNSGAEHLTGYGAEDIVGESCARLFAQDGPDESLSLDRLLQGADAGHYEAEGWCVRNDGSRYFGHVALSVLRVETGEPRGYACVMSDVTARREAEDRAREAVARQRLFLKEVLCSVTEGRLRLCFGPDEMPAPLSCEGGAVPLEARRLSQLRQRLRDLAVEDGYEDSRWEDLVNAAGEAAMNAVVHAGGGEARIYSEPGKTLQVWIEDHGTGIAEERLHRVTLERGFSSAGSWGHGFWMMLKMADRVWLLTGQQGTTVVIEQDREAPEPDWFGMCGSLVSPADQPALLPIHPSAEL